MTAGRIRHWKHGWIPISPQAKAYVAGRGPKPVTTAPDRAKMRDAWRAAHPDGDTRDGVTSKQNGGYRLTTVDGYPEVYFQEVLELDRRPPEQYREVAKTVHDVLAPYPRAVQANPVEIGFSNELMPTVMADTNATKPHKIRVNIDMWDKPEETMARAREMREHHFGITGEADTIEQFRKNVITHELGHELHMRDLDEMEHVPVSQAGEPYWGALEGLTQETVTPRSLGFTRDLSDPDMGPATREWLQSTLDMPQPRWQADALNGRSTYANSNQFEFYAEAFTDGTMNGDRASESGKRAVAIARTAFGPGSPSVRDRLYGKGAS